MKLGTWPMPQCFVCKKIVQEFTYVTDYQHDRLIFIAKCHGAREVSYFTGLDMICTDKVERGSAFSCIALPDGL